MMMCINIIIEIDIQITLNLRSRVGEISPSGEGKKRLGDKSFYLSF